jgi:hypothetical protein
MNFDGLEIVYLICFFLGLGFAVISALLAGVFSGGAEAHVDVGGHHVDMGHGMEGHVHFPILSPVTIAMAILAFGGSGMVYKKALDWPTAGHLAASTATAAAVALGVATLLYKLFKATSGSSHGTAAEAVGLEAEVTVAIPHQGLGEIAYVVRGTRMTNPAKTADGKELPPQTVVRIVREVSGVYFVEKPKG